MKIGIYHQSGSFSDTWIKYCQEHGIPYQLVDAYYYDIIDQLKGCNVFMWHFAQHDYRDMLMARPLLNAVEKMGIRVFPDYETNWHFDDKIGEQYLLEAIGAPVVPGYVFYTLREALEWIDKSTFPKVFKLRGGAGAANVRLVRKRSEARRLARVAFGRGFSQFDRWGYLKDRYQKWKDGKTDLFHLLKSCGHLVVPTEYARMHGREKGYVYFQEFIPGNTFDIRIVVCGKRAFGIKRLVRENDFRASGSGHILYAREEIDERCVRIAFDVNRKIRAQSLALDFVFDAGNHPLVVELSYGYVLAVYKDKCPGFWNENLEWHDGFFDPQEWQIEDLIKLSE